MKVLMPNVLDFINLKIKEQNDLLDNEDLALSKEHRIKLTHYKEAYNILKDELLSSWDFNCQNIIFDVLTENFGKYDTKIIFWGDEELIIDKHTVTTVDGGFIFIHPKNKEDLHDFYNKGFNIENIKKIETIKEEGLNGKKE